MTAFQLLLAINAALLLQLLIGGAVVWTRRRGADGRTAPSVPPAPTETALDWPGLRPFRVARREFEDANRTQCSFVLAPVDGILLKPFRPGQFLTFALDLPDAMGGASRSITRCYSISDAPRTDAYRITVKRVTAPPGRSDLPPGVASGHLHEQVQEGDVLRVRAPSGRFFLDADPELPAVLIAGGIGITPMMSMLAWCLEHQPSRSVHLFYGVRNSLEHVWKSLFESLAERHPSFHLNVVYSQPGPYDVLGRDYQHTPYVDVALLRRTLPRGRLSFYVCGPPSMLSSLVPGLLGWGVPAEDIHFEAFGPASLAPVQQAGAAEATSGEASVEVRFRRSERTLLWTGQDASLLDFAERHGVAVESGCRSGSCGSCETPVASGGVFYAVKPDHEVAPGHCLLCVGKPQSALELEA